MSYYDMYRRKFLEIFSKYFNFKQFKFKDGGRTFYGGKLICKKCSKEYKWKDWKYRKRAYSLALKHVRTVHDSKIKYIPILLKWIEEFERKFR